MATIKKLKRNKNWGKKPSDGTIIDNMAWYVKDGEEYDLVQFEIEELEKHYYWITALAVPCKWSDEKVNKAAEEFAEKRITEKDISSYVKFLTEGETWGWD